MNRTILAALCGMFLMGSAWGQTKPVGHTSQPEPLTCGKYQHVESRYSCEEGFVCPVGDSEHLISHPRCVDDMHSVTEREWQELQARMKALEATPEKKMPTANIIPAIPNGSVCPYGYSYERICADLDGKGNFKFPEKICTMESEGQWCVKDRPISKSAR